MTAATMVARLLCPRCHWSPIAKTCTCQAGSLTELAELAERVQERHQAAVARAAMPFADRPLPEAPAGTRWVAALTRRDVVHLLDTSGRSLCGKASCGLGSRPAQNGATWCRLCAHIGAGA